MTVKNVRLKNQSGDQLIPDVGIPSQSGNNGKVLGTNGSNLVWVTQQGGGGGSSYTAGDGIIIENNEISVDGQTTSEIDTETVSETTLATVATTGAFSDLSGTSGLQTTANLVTSVSSSSTDSQYPSAKLFYDTIGNIETLLSQI